MRVLPLVLALALLAPLAAGHALTSATDPAAGAKLARSPERIVADFTEPLDPAATSVAVLDANGEAVSIEPFRLESPTRLVIELPTPLPNGGYLVTWETISATDGHRTAGGWSFVIGQGELLDASHTTSTSFRMDAVGGKLLLYAGAALLLGASAHAAYVTRHASRERLVRVARAGGALLLVGTLVFLGSQILASGLGALAYLTTTAFGRAMVARTALAFFAFALVFAPRPRVAIHGGAAVVTALLVVASAYSHTAAFLAPRALAVALSALHEASLLLWAGSLALLLVHVRRLPADGVAPLDAFEASARFGRVAIACVATGAATGAAMLVVLLGPDWTTWLRPGYSGSLLAHTALGGAMIALGGANRWLLVPTLRRDAARDALRAFRRLVTGESALAVAVILLAAAMTNLQPPLLVAATEAPPAAPPAFYGLLGDTYGIHFTMDPGPARNADTHFSIHVYRYSDASPVEGAYSALLRFTHVETGSMSDHVALQEMGNGTYETQGAFFAIAGTYAIEVILQTDEVFEERVRVDVIVR